MTAEDDEKSGWRQAIAGVQRLHQDKVVLKVPRRERVRLHRDVTPLPDPISDVFDPFCDDDERHDLRWFDLSLPAAAVRRLKRGDVTHEHTLDLHGLRVAAAKQELLKFFAACLLEDVRCVRIMHGRGTGKIAENLNRWLRQHPQVLGFHPAPLRLGSHGAVLVLLRSRRD